MDQLLPSFVFNNNRRWVVPYYYCFSSYAKERWIGYNILDIYANNFKTYSKDYYKNAINIGNIKVNKNTISEDYIIQNGDYLQHFVHLHEPSVINQDIHIIYECNDYIVIDKPASMPTHKGGLYQFNSALSITQYILNNNNNKKNNIKLNPLHRLDRVVSGILVFSKTSNFAKLFATLLNNNQIDKYYICRVYGRFPNDSIICNQSIGRSSGLKWKCYVDHKNGKDSKTCFQFLSYNEQLNQSLVLCIPYTGRQHQLRVHLSYLGYPIVLDRLYASDYCNTDSITNYSYPFSYTKDKVCIFCNPELYNTPEHNDTSWDQIYLHSFCYKMNITNEILTYHTKLPKWTQEKNFKPLLQESNILNIIETLIK